MSSSSLSIFDSGSGLNQFLSSPIGSKLTNVFTDVVSNVTSGLVKTKAVSQSSNGQVQSTPIVYQNNPKAGGLMNSIGFGNADGSTNWLMVGGAAIVLALIAFLVLKNK